MASPMAIYYEAALWLRRVFSLEIWNDDTFGGVQCLHRGPEARASLQVSKHVINLWDQHLLRRCLDARRRWRRHPVSSVIHVDIITQMTVEEYERTLRKPGTLMPEHINVTDSVFRPY